MSVLKMTDTEFLSKISTLAGQIRASLPPVPPAEERQVSGTCVSPLLFANSNQQVLNFDLSNLGVDDSRHATLTRIYAKQLDDLQLAFHNEYGKLISIWHQERLYEETQDQALRRTFSLLYSIHSQRLWEALLQEVVEHQRTARTPARPSSGDPVQISCEGEPLRAGRGHDSDAVRILEQAFEHTPNITQAEKFQLAEATGLQPKQVTIWFQNRRNRKGKKGPKLAITYQSDADPSSFKHGSPPDSPTRDFALSEKKRKSYGALGRDSLDSSSYDSDSSSSLPKKPRLPSAESDVSDGSASSYEHHSAFTCWSTPSSRSNSSSLDSSGMSDFDSPRKPRNVFDYIKPRTLDVKAITSMPRLTIPAPQQHAFTNAASGQPSPFLCDSTNGNVATGTNLDFGGLQFNFDGIANDQSFRENVQRVLSSMSGYEADTSRNVSSSSWTSQQTATDDDGWEDVDDSIAPHLNWGSQGQSLPGQEVAQTTLLPRAQSAPLDQTNNDSNTGSGNAYPQPQPFDNDSFDLSQFFQSASMPTHMPPMAMFPHQHGLFEVPLPSVRTQEIGEIEKPLDMDLDDIQSILDSNIFASSLPNSQQSNGESAPQGANVQGQNALAGAGMGEGVFQMNFDLDSNSFGFV